MGYIKQSLSSRGAAIAALVLVSVAVYANTLSYGFTYDDNEQVLNNLWIRDLRHLPDIFTSPVWSFQEGKTGTNYYRPVMHLVYMAWYHVFGLKAWGFHLLNVVLHSLNAVVLFLVASFLFSEEDDGTPALLFPFLTALFFIVHPVNAEVASWVSAVPELTFTLFTLLSFHLYLTSRNWKPGYFLSVAFFFIALLSKETAVVLPLMLAGYDLAVRGGIRRYWKYVPYLIVALLYMAVRTSVIGGLIQKSQIDLTPYESVLNVFPLIARYVWKLVLPVDLNALYVFYPVHSITETRVLLSVLLTLVLAAAVLFSRRKGLVFFSLLWVFMPILPVLYVPALQTAAFAERYLYLPSAGFSLLLAWGLKWLLNASETHKLKGLKVPVLVFTAIIIGSYTTGAVVRSTVWRDDLTLWEDTVRKSPDSTNAHYNLAWAYHRRGESRKAALHYREAIRLDPGSADAHYNLGSIYMKEYLLDEAAVEFQEALDIDPGYAAAERGLKKALEMKGIRR